MPVEKQTDARLVFSQRKVTTWQLIDVSFFGSFQTPPVSMHCLTALAVFSCLTSDWSVFTATLAEMLKIIGQHYGTVLKRLNRDHVM